ncbi:hypothetical protein DTO207G8_6817 [Paecilomyces variotii]|nr:hypothetical protein DTO207G8_6817 [Paecilomyces variotii]
MVTPNGDSRYYPPGGHDGTNGLPERRRMPPPWPLENTGYAVPTPTTAPEGRIPHSPRTPVTARYQPAHGSPQPQPSTPQNETFHPPRSPPLQYGLGSPYGGRIAYRSPTYPTFTPDQIGQWPLGPREPHDRWTPPRRPPGRPGLRISMSMSKLNSRRPNYFVDDYHQVDTSPQALSPPSLGPPRFPSHVSDKYGDDPGRCSMNSAITSSSVEQTSGTERSSVMTKSSSVTDLSPDTPDGPYAPYEKDGGMSVEDAISMYLDGFSDVPEEDTDEVERQDVIATGDSDQASGPTETDEEFEVSSPRYEIAAEDEHNWSSNPTELDEQAERRTESLLEAMGTSMGDTAEIPEYETDNPSPADQASEESVRPPVQETKIIVPGVVPPPLLSGSGDRDRYGFRKATHHVTIDQYESWNRQYTKFQEHRKLKWRELLKESNLDATDPSAFPPKSNKIKRYIRKGIPSEYRGAAWFWYAGGFDHLHRNPGLYDQLVERAMGSPTNDDKEHIERDLHRTFPDNIHFKPEMPVNSEGMDSNSGSSNPIYSSAIVETELIRSLRHVLYAFSLHNPRVGYTQSLNFITGMLLLFLPEEKAFWMLHIITSVLLPGTHEISLEGANVDLWILMVLLRESLPSIYNKVASAGPTTSKTKVPAMTVQTRLPDVTLGLTNWLMSLFIGSLPLETTLRVWDVFFYEGSKTFFRVALAIFKASEKEILAVSDPMEVFQIIQTVPKKLLDANSLLEESFARRYRVGQGRVDSLRAARRVAVREEKLRRSMMGNAGPLNEAARPSTSRAKSPMPALEHGIADTWRNMKHHAFR